MQTKTDKNNYSQGIFAQKWSKSQTNNPFCNITNFLVQNSHEDIFQDN